MPDSPNKKYYDPRIWLGAGEASFTKRLISFFEDLNCVNRTSGGGFAQTDPRVPDAGDAAAQLGRIQKAVALMETNFASKLTVDLLARVSGLSAYHFSRLFKATVGVSPHQYLLRCRLRHAKTLLLKHRERRSLADVAAECGFADQAHLSRHFRRAYGMSLLEFRRRPR
jgi:transcriptional regulator GlxA family with amidase domain